MVYAVFTEDGLDQVCGSEREAKQEVKDLKGMGFNAKSKAFESENKVYAHCEAKGIHC